MPDLAHHHQQIFTPHDGVSTNTDKFHLFAALPTELRVEIWQQALRRERIIQVRLRNRLTTDKLLARQDDHRPASREDERYCVIVNGLRTISKLFRVNRESRYAARSFFRAHVPCWMVRDAVRDSKMEPCIMYFNPEYDYLHISNDTGHVAEFIHDLKTAHDPRNVGLLNLVASINDLTGTGGICTIEPSTLDHPLRKSFADTLLQLRQVFFHQTQMLGRQPFPLAITAPDPDEAVANRAFPIETFLPTFRRLRPDPRPIKRELSNVFVNVDPRRMLLAWRQLLRAYLGADEVPQTELRVLLTHGSYGKVDSVESARARLEYEQTLWTERLGLFSLEGSVATAFGFWLIPTTAFRALPESDHMFRSDPPQLMDLREHWPDLAVTDFG